ncbi:MAG: DUF2460 domain-containing protein [Alphaproteobacteria bacterium]|nr:DUF2460 domain-containing protein [Alphaproteobacteria bacterium]
MNWDDVRFPTSISRGSTSTAERRTDVVVTASGREERNARWANSKRKYNAGFGLKSLDDIQTVVAFFEERRGRLYAFRWKDFADFKSCAASATHAATDQVIGTGTGTQATFQLVKIYGAGTRNYARVISTPVTDTVKVAVNGVVTTQFVVNPQTGVVTFNAGYFPAAGTVVTAGFEFDVPVRFDTDQISINRAHFAGGDIPSIPLVEVKP